MVIFCLQQNNGVNNVLCIVYLSIYTNSQTCMTSPMTDEVMETGNPDLNITQITTAIA